MRLFTRPASAGLIGMLIGSLLTIVVQIRISKSKVHNSFQLAAMDKRLETHQKAFYLWTKMRAAMWATIEDRRWVSYEAINFWNSHCLYLEHEASVQFLNCIGNFYEYQFNNSRMSEYDTNTKEREDSRLELRKAIQQVKNTGKYISEGAKYPFFEPNQFSKEDKKVTEELENT